MSKMITLPSGIEVDAAAPAYWNPALLLQMRFQAESLADQQRARVKISNRVNRYLGSPSYLTLLPAMYVPLVSPPIVNPDFTAMLGGYEVEKISTARGKLEVKLKPLLAERELWKRLVEIYRRVAPMDVIAWQEAAPGIGEELLARLIGLTGNPRIATPMHMEEGEVREVREDGSKSFHYRDPVPDGYEADEITAMTHERTLRQWWSYCGIGSPDRVPTQGMGDKELKALGRRRVRAVMFNMTNAIVLATQGKNATRPKAAASPYPVLYATTKLQYEMKLHSTPCVRCGTATTKNGPGKPAPIGSAWSPAHRDASARRVLAKQVLKDLWQRS